VAAAAAAAAAAASAYAGVSVCVLMVNTSTGRIIAWRMQHLRCRTLSGYSSLQMNEKEL
jgi:hypothetical protein